MRLYDRSAWRTFRKKVMERDGYACNLCSKKTGRFEIDHVIPLKKGGKTEMANLQTLCRQCHFKKTLDENNEGRDESEDAKKHRLLSYKLRHN